MRIDGLIGPDIDQGLCGKTLIVECERICPSEELRGTPERNQIAPHFVSAIVCQPFGAYPTAVPDYYDYDYSWFHHYTAAVKKKSYAEVQEYWLEHVASTADEWDFLERSGGIAKVSALRADPCYRYNPDIDR